jgi:hypothetical protein
MRISGEKGKGVRGLYGMLACFTGFALYVDSRNDTRISRAATVPFLASESEDAASRLYLSSCTHSCQAPKN